MKDYKDVARSVFRRRNEYLQEKKRKRDAFMKRSAVALSCCLMVLVSFNIWRTDALKTIAPSPDRSQFNVTEANTTDPVTTDLNGMTDIPDTPSPAVTTVNGQNNKPVQNGTTALSNKDNTVTTTRTKSGNKPVRTTDSFMIVTFTQYTSAATTSAHKTSAAATTAAKTTTAKTSSTSAQRTTAKATTTSRHAAEPQKTTSRPVTTSRSATTSARTTTRSYTTTSAVYSTTRHYTTTARHTSTVHPSTSVHYTTSRVYTTSYADVNPVATENPEPIAATTTSTSTTTVVYTHTTATRPIALTTMTGAHSTSITTSIIGGFNYNGTYYKTTGTKVDRSTLKNYLGRKYDPNSNTIFYFYAHDDFDPEFMCFAATDWDDEYAYLGVNESWQPETLGDILNGADFDDYINTPYVYDTAENHFYKIADESAVRELLRSYSDKKVQTAGLSFGAEYVKSSDRIPSFDLSSKLGYIELRTHGMSAEGHYLQHGYISITTDGKLEVDIFYLKYTIDIGMENADELMRKLKTI